MIDQFDNIEGFSKYRELCFFCSAKLKCRLTNFVGSNGNSLPLLNAYIKNDKLTFDLCHTTPSYTVKATVKINIKTNSMVLTLMEESDTPAIDAATARSTFHDLGPHIQLHCSNRRCKYQYTIASEFLKLQFSDGKFFVCPVGVLYTSFVTGNLWVQNDYLREQTNIYSRVKTEAKPLVAPLMDFEAMGVNKVLNRVRTIVVFS